MDSRSLGLVVIAAGLILVVAGAAIWGGLLGWFGRLPGDFQHQGDNVRVYVPLASMLVVSVVLSLALMLFNRLR